MISIEIFTEDKIDDVMEFETELRKQEPGIYFMDAGEGYRQQLRESFHDPRFCNALSLLAYKNGKVIGRIDATLLGSRSDACCCSAYLDWICVLKQERHHKVAQLLLKELRNALKQKNVETLIGIVASNEESRRFYAAVENASIHDEAIWTLFSWTGYGSHSGFRNPFR